MMDPIHVGLGKETEGDALVKLQIGREGWPGETIKVGFSDLFAGAVGAAVANALIGHTSGTATTAWELLSKDNAAAASSGGLTILGVFTAYFVAGATLSEIRRRWDLRRKEDVLGKAGGWEHAFAKKGDDGRWVVAKGDLGGQPDHMLAALGKIAEWECAVLDEAEFREFERRVAAAGGTLKKLHIDGDRMAMLTTVGGKLHSLGGEPAIRVWGGGCLVHEQWYESGRKVPNPGLFAATDWIGGRGLGSES